jgi:uncharacterized protein YbcI
MSADGVVTGPSAPTTHGMGAEISTRMVQLLREFTGRGPTKARTYMHEDLIVVVLQDTLSRGEHAVAEHVGPGTVLNQRKAFQDAIRKDATAMVEELTGRSVAAFLSDNHIDPDIAVEVFVLVPNSD